jgi:hypothetical protein
MKLHLIIGFVLLVTVRSDLLDQEFFQNVYRNILLKEPIFKVNFIIRTRLLTLTMNAAYDAIVPYRSKLIGINSNIPKRPDSERTQRNKNIAIAYAFLRVSQNVYPPVVPKLESLYRSLGLDLTDTTLDLTTPIGIGNFAGKNLIEDRINDRQNQLGNLNGK